MAQRSREGAPAWRSRRSLGCPNIQAKLCEEGNALETVIVRRSGRRRQSGGVLFAVICYDPRFVNMSARQFP